MKPILVIGDLHNRWREAEAIIESLKGRYRKAIFLGDYFDDFGDTPRDAADVAKWLAQSLAKPERIHLLGNHDMPYVFPGNPHLHCPGFSWEKYLEAKAFLDAAPREQLRLAHFEDGWLFSHAGFAAALAEDSSPELLTKEADRVLSTLGEDRYEPLVACGAGRGGRSLTGGVTWLDWWSEFVPIQGINQIVGHTPGSLCKAQLANGADRYPSYITAKEPRTYRYRKNGKAVSGSVNWCLDCRLAQVALVRPASVEIVDTGVGARPC